MKGAIAAGHPLTAEAGARVLAEGGNAVDACVAAAFAAWVAESPLTGPGAGGFALVRPADGRPAQVADFFVATPGRGHPTREAAEMEAIDVGFGDSETTQVFRIGEASCAVPGAAAGLAAVHDAYGQLPWAELLRPAIELARDGIELTKPQAHLHAILDLILRHADEGRHLYSRPDGARLQPGDTLALPDLADTLERIAAEGADAFYRGELAEAIAETAAAGGGTLTVRDLEEYEVAWREPVHVRYHGHEVISNPPPSSGGLLIAYGLGLLERIGRGESRSTSRRWPRSCASRHAPAVARSSRISTAASCRAVCCRRAGSRRALHGSSPRCPERRNRPARAGRRTSRPSTPRATRLRCPPRQALARA